MAFLVGGHAGARMSESAGDRARRNVPAVGPLLGRYRLAAQPEREGMPVAAWDTQAARAVSVAGLGRPLTTPERARLARARRVEHPALARPLAEGETVLGPVVVTELVTGRPLAVVAQEEAPGPRALREILTPVAAALEALHAAGLAHGALALDQVWVGEDGQIVLWGAAVPRSDWMAAPSAADDILALGRITAGCLSAGSHARTPAVTAALSADPAARPARPSEVLAGLGRPHAEEVTATPAGTARRRLAAVGAVALLGLVGIALLATAGEDPAPPAAGRARTVAPPPVVQAAGVGLSVPGPWRRIAGDPITGTLGLRDPLVLSRSGARLVAGRVVHPDPVTLLPRTLRISPRAHPVVLNGRVARRWMLAERPAPGVAFLVPAVRGRPVLLLCAAARGGPLADCERLVAGAKLPRSGPLDPDPRLAAALATIRRDLDGASARSQRQLKRQPRIGPRSAGTLRRLARAFDRGAVRLRAAPATPAARPALLASARAAARFAHANRRLAADLKSRRRRDTAPALRAIFRAIGAAVRPVRLLEALGYRRAAQQRPGSANGKRR